MLNLYGDISDAMSAAVTLFHKAKTDDPAFVFQANVAGKRFFTALSTKQTKQYKVSPKKAVLKVGDSQSQLEIKKKFQDSLPDQKTLKVLRAHGNLYRAEKRLRKVLSISEGVESGSPLASNQS